MVNVPPNDPNVDASAIVPTPVNPDHAPTQPVGRGGRGPRGGSERRPGGGSGRDDDDDMEIDDDAEVIDPYIDDGSNNPPPPNSKDEETPPTSPVILDADDQPIPPIALFGQNFHFATIWAERERERVQNEANRAEGPNVALVAWNCTFTDFMKCSPITFRGNKGAVGGNFGNKSCDQENMGKNEGDDDRGILSPKEIQMMKCELWNLRVKEMDISSYTTHFNELVILCHGMVPTERKKVEAYIRGLSKNI
nr:hypothetical protein [Tanacetum cinerariifolium]